MVRGEITLADALERLEANSVKQRAEGLSDLKHVFRNNSSYDSLGDGSFHRIFETLFRVAVGEKETYLKSKAPTIRKASENRLSTCAGALRLAVEAGVHQVKLKTVRSVLDHIIQTLLHSGGGIFEPLALDYVKCLKALLNYQPHVEHLTREDRERVEVFCVECIKSSESELADDHAMPGAEFISLTGTTTGLSNRSSRSHLRDSGDSQSDRSLAKQITEEIVTCLSMLTAAPNAAEGSMTEELLSTLINLLRNTSMAGRSPQDAFTTMNHLLAWTRTEDIKLTQRMASPLVRLIRHYWSAKSSPVFKDQMLITWLYLRPYACYIMVQDDCVTFRSELSTLLDVLRSEYCRRTERDQLRLDELRLDLSDTNRKQSNLIGSSIFYLRCSETPDESITRTESKTQSEAKWATVHAIATLCTVLDSQIEDADSSGDEEDEINPRPRKRQRLTREIDDVLISSTNRSTAERICALQTLTFLAQQRPFSTKQLMKNIDKLSTTAAEDNAVISSWAFMALASFASLANSTDSTLSSRWTSVWQLATRAMSSSSTCRTACHLAHVMIKLQLIPPQSVSELVETVTSSMDVNGPSMLAESVSHVLVSAVKAAQNINPVSASATAESVLGWLFRNFTPSRFEDKAYASQRILYEPKHVVGLVAYCLGQPDPHVTVPQFPLWGPVGQVWLLCEEQRELIAYLLLLREPTVATHDSIYGLEQVLLSSSRPRVSCEALVLNHLISELFRTQEIWNQQSRERPRGINSDVFASLCDICVTATCIAFCNIFRDSRRQSQLQRQVQELLEALSDFLSRPECAQDKVDLMLTAFSRACAGLQAVEEPFAHPLCEKILCQTISNGMMMRWNTTDYVGLDEDEYAMDLVERFDSQDSRNSDQYMAMGNFRHEHAVSFSKVALRASLKTYAAITSMQHGTSRTEDSGETVSKRAVDYILSLPQISILSSRSVLSSLSYLGVDVTADDAYRLLDFFSDKMLSSYVYERSEVALGAIIDIMSNLAPAWTNPDNSSLFELGIDMYDWYTSTALSGGVLSPIVQKRVAGLLLQLCHINTDYGRDSDVPSVRTSLFKLLQLGSITVQFHLANRISTIFGLFVLSNHSAMFNDLQMSLPADAEWIEGMAMRLLFLAKLASAWHSLLRQCIYYIFETAGRVKPSAKHAARSVQELAASQKFRTPQKLFQLFAPQLLHTWLESHSVASLPFAIFQYESLDALIAQNRCEITAQLLVRGNDEGIDHVLGSLKIGIKDLIVRCFAKCQAYCISCDISKMSAEANEATSESRLRKLIGNKEEYKTLVTSQFPAIMGQFYLSLQQEDVEDNWLEKRPRYSSATATLSEIKSFGYSDRDLPPSQQPSFKSKYLCDQSERLCRRTGHDPIKPWESSSFALAARMLIESFEDALGPLHNCMVIRKLRLLICMAGDVAITGFPLEMLIHTLRPFLNDSQCADDTMGILQYLLHRGQQHLQTNLPFLYGSVTLMILQMRKHSGPRQDSTTQESQHKSTVQRMRALQTWLAGYLRNIQPSVGSSAAQRYSRFAKALEDVYLPGNAKKGTPESSLLLLLLEQGGGSDVLIRSTDREEALILLSEKFQMPNSASDDCLGNGDDCVEFAPEVWNAIQIQDLSEVFIAWAAGVLGRAYASTGRRPFTTAAAVLPKWRSNLTQQGGIAKSQTSIAQRLSELLFSRDRSQASVADHTLRSIVLSFRNAEEAVAFEQMLPTAIVPAIADGTCGHEPFLTSNMQPGFIDDHFHLPPLEPPADSTLEAWAQNLSVKLCQNASDTAILPALVAALRNDQILAVELLPCLIHILLAKEVDKDLKLRAELSTSIAAYLADSSETVLPKQRFIIQLLLYLRGQPLPTESTQADRLQWLDVDWLVASDAAMRCGMPTAALLFAESSSPSSHGGKRTSSRASLSPVSLAQVSQKLLLSIFKAVEEPDSFYGVEQPASLNSVLDRLDYEADGFRSLMFRSAQNDTHLRHKHQLAQADTSGMIRSLSALNLDSLTFALLSSGFSRTGSSEELVSAALRLQQWEIVPSDTTSEATSNCFSAFQELDRATERQSMQPKLHSLLLRHARPMTKVERMVQPPSNWFSALASLVETNDIINSSGQGAFQASWSQIKSRQLWMPMARYDDFRSILSNRQTLLSVLVENKSFLASMRVGKKDCRAIQIESLLNNSRISREHAQLQDALAAANQVSNLIDEGNSLDFKAHASVKLETASVLWDLGEATASVKMLQEALAVPDLESQDVVVGRSGLLAQLAHQLAEARLEKPDEILARYLNPAISHLQGRNDGQEAGKVFYEFATFCDKQLQNPDNNEELNRIAKLRQKKLEEVEELQRLAKSASRPGTNQKDYNKSMSKAQQWFEIDDADYQRLKRSRDTFLQQSLQNYMLALRASNEHDISILRFFALWLENADEVTANSVVDKHLPNIPSWKFVVLMNQLMSRLENDDSPFQKSLKSLATRICADHPHHSLHHLFASSRKPSSPDQAAQSRYDVAMSIRMTLRNDAKGGKLLAGFFLANNQYHKLATEEGEKSKGSRVYVKDSPAAYELVKTVPDLGVSPATINLQLRPTGDYNDVPTVTKFGSTVQFMSGNSRPKKLTAYASDGKQYPQLFKSGDDDLRQDAIMEQVFGEVSSMLRNHKTTRQRNLQVRTYKVIPLSQRSGIIEFVPNSTSFADFLAPAHERYHPQDYNYSTARQKINQVQNHATAVRIKEFRKVCERLRPVLRHFFFERYTDPDEWFEKRTAYTRTTATISILGYVLGLGDRHCQNIMLDEKTGEVVHIDLGIAFEAGRVLPVPELVPFRLTRDVVDGMGITKTEGVFRRCCEFTMDALREDQGSIMTLLNVLRYDPLYAWTVSPIRAKRMQEEMGRIAASAENGANGGEGNSKKRQQEAGEADRALSIVEKKLSKTLSTAATVNELIQQATDERNLATLFMGWAAFF